MRSATEPRRCPGIEGDFDQAIADCNEAIRLDPKESAGYDDRAWIWATSADARYRDGKRAVESATRACELTDWKGRQSHTLAAACAEAGDFARGGEVAGEGAGAEQGREGREKGRARLELYRATKPYREQPSAR